MNFRRAFTPLALVLAGTAPMMAQETVGSLVGTVTNNATKKPLAGVRLVLHSPKMLGERTAVTGADGTYRFNLLPNGEYTLSLSASGFNASSVKMGVLPGQTTRQDARLAPVQTVTVEVVADSAAQIDKTETTVQTVYAMDSITTLTGGDLTRILDVAPAVQAGSTEKGSTISVRGGNTTGAKFLVNGLDASDPGWGTFDASKMMISDMVETVAVIASPLNSRYGNTESGMVSYVTTRGSNEFKGSIRATYSVDGTFGYSPQPSRQVGRFGTDDNDGHRYPGSGAASRNWEATISGPLWKDHITFAWGGRFYPNTSARTMVAKDWNPDSKYWQTSFGGTLMPLPGGAQIRRADTYDMGKYYDNVDSTSFNQYALFWQINANHSLDWSYSEFKDDATSLDSTSANISSPGYSNIKNNNRIWNLAYKGLVGPGVLEARMGRTTYDVIRPDATDPKYASIQTQTASTYYSGNMAGSNVNSSQMLHSWGGSDSAYPYSNLFEARSKGGYQLTKTVFGAPYDKGETKSNTSFMVNYQMAPGSHLIDVGVNYVKTHWDTAIGSNSTNFYVPGGQIARDLTDADILYPGGYGGGRLSASNYAGKWVVWDASASTVGLWPDYEKYNGAATGGKAIAKGALGVPSMTKYYGQEGGGFDEKTTSFYANDNWQINNHWGVMAGARYDKFSLDDSAGNVLSYGTLSPRLEVKYDLGGDQRRVLSYSWAKFSNRMPSAAFLSLVHRRKPYSVTTLWDTGKMGVDANGNPLKGGYRAVSTAELMDPSNYTYYSAQNNPDIYRLGKNFKGDYNIEQTINFRRAYENGSNWRAGLVYRKWYDNYQWFLDTHASYITNPYSPTQTTKPEKDVDPTWTPHRDLRNDDRLFHTYHSFELEWNFVLSKRATFSGNYTYSRNYSNQMFYAAQSNFSEHNVGVLHAPWGINVTEPWELLGVSLDDQAQISVVRNQVANAWVSYDLSRGALKQSLVFRAHWEQGSTFTNFNNTDIDTYSEAWKTIMKNANLPADFTTGQNLRNNYGSEMHLRFPGTNIGDWKNPDYLTFNLKYNLDVPITNQIRWTVGIECINLFGKAYQQNQVDYLSCDVSSPVNSASIFWADGSRPKSRPYFNGYRIPAWQMYKPSGDFNEGGRYFVFETGLKF